MAAVKWIHDQPYYFGHCTREMMEQLLMSRNTGDFIVRAFQKAGTNGYFINMRNDDYVDNFFIKTDIDGRYYLRSDKMLSFPSVVELVEYHKHHPMPNKLRLKHGVSRPHWLIHPTEINYNQENRMGSGNFSDVYHGTVQRPGVDLVKCAIKVLHFKNVGDLEAQDKGREQFLTEARIHTSYEHMNVVQMFGVMVDTIPFIMVMELCHGGSLDKHMEKYGNKITIFEKELYLYEAAMGMYYLHMKGCIHRDLAARNCLIGDDGRIKISDFGLSLFSPDGRTLTEKLDQVPLRWMAPECLRREQSFSFKTDVWAYGVLMFEIFSNGSKPFASYQTDTEEMKMIRAIRKAEMPAPPEGTPETMGKIMRDIWQKEAHNRPAFAQIVDEIQKIIQREKTVPLAELILNQLKDVKRAEYPAFDWSQEKEHARERQKMLDNLQEADERRARARLEREKKRTKARVKSESATKVLFSCDTAGLKESPIRQQTFKKSIQKDSWFDKIFKTKKNKKSADNSNKK